MSGPGDSASMWQKLTMQSAADDVQQDWVALCAAWDKFHASMERHLGATAAVPSMFKPSSVPVAEARPLPPPFPTTNQMHPIAPAPPAKPTDAELAGRERSFMERIQAISNEVAGKITQIQTAYMGGSLGPNQTNPMMAQQYNFALGALQMLRVEASALADAGRGDGLRTLDLSVDDLKKAIAIVGGMVNQQREFEMGISKIWQETNTSLVDTQMEINRNTRQAYEEANKKFSV